MPVWLPCNYVGRLKLLSLGSLFLSRKHNPRETNLRGKRQMSNLRRFALLSDAEMTIKQSIFGLRRWAPQRCVKKIFELLVKMRRNLRKWRHPILLCFGFRERNSARCDFSAQRAALMKSDRRLRPLHHLRADSIFVYLLAAVIAVHKSHAADEMRRILLIQCHSINFRTMQTVIAGHHQS